MKKKLFLLLLLVAGTMVVNAAPSDIVGLTDVERSMDSIVFNIDNLEDMVRNNLFTSISSPVMFTGMARIKLSSFYWGDSARTPAGILSLDRQRFTFWEGNESAIRVGMVVRPPGGHTMLWSKLGFNTTFAGNMNRFHALPTTIPDVGAPDMEETPYIGHDASRQDTTGWVRAQIRHDKDNSPLNIHEDMSAGISIRYPGFSLWARMGNVIWTQASPLTIWKAQPRNFAWDYLPFEIEQPIGMYYYYNVVKGEKTGRAAWNRKPFQGIQLESITMPGDVYFNFLYAKFENFDNKEPEYVDFATDRGLAWSNIPGFSPTFEEDFKAKGIGDGFRWMTHARVARPFGSLTLGANYINIRYNEDFIYLGLMLRTGDTLMANTPGEIPGRFYDRGINFYKETDVLSLDGVGQIPSLLGGIDYKFDVGFSIVDTQYFHLERRPAEVIDNVRRGERTTTGIAPAIYGELGFSNIAVPVKLSMVYVDKEFYSPFSFVAPHESIYPYGANLLGAGKFVARGEASPYVPNMAGVNATIQPRINDGRARFNIGYHGQLEEGFNAVYFPYILNGIVMSQATHSSIHRWGNGRVTDTPGYRELGFLHYQRLGLGSQVRGAKGVGYRGGFFVDYLSAYEGFVAFENAEDARNANHFERVTIGRVADRWTEEQLFRAIDSITRYYQDERGMILDPGFRDPVFNLMREARATYDINELGLESRKTTHNYSIDAAYNVGRLFGMERKLYAGLFAGYYEISNANFPSFDKDGVNTLLYGTIVRFEPAFQLFNNLYIIGVAGVEDWYSNKAYMAARPVENGDVNYHYEYNGVRYLLFPDERYLGETGAVVIPVPIDNRSIAYGLGFDWDIMQRTSFHFRASRHIKTDRNVGMNNYDGVVVTGEVKAWF